MLEIAVHGDDGRTARLRQSGHQSSLMSEVSREPHQSHSRAIDGGGGDSAGGFIATAIVHEQELKIAVQRLQNAESTVQKGRNVRGFVVHRDDDGQNWAKPGRTHLIHVTASADFVQPGRKFSC
jgi:hypothetical protein